MHCIYLCLSPRYLFIYLLNLTTGNGGDAGRQTLHVLNVRGKVELKTCRGTGGQPAVNGLGGDGEDSQILH